MEQATRNCAVPGAAFGLLILTACGEPTPGGEATVRDSAGVTIVESSASLWDQTGPTSVAEEVVLQLGTIDGEEAEKFYGVRGIRWLDQTRFVLINGDTQVRVYHMDGALARQFGRDGDGPGEYRAIGEVGPLPGDRLLLTDSRRRLVRTTTLDGEVERATSIEHPIPGGADWAGDGWLVGFAAEPRLTPEMELRVDSIVAINTETTDREVWGVTPGSPIIWRDLPNGQPAPMSLANGPDGVIEARHDRIVYGTSDVYELRELDTAGGLVRILRRQVAARVPTEETGRPVVARWEAAGSPEYARPVFADSLPHFRSFLLDDAGRTWVQRDPGYGHPALEWDLFDDRGIYLGAVLLPESFTPHDVIGDLMIGVWTDALDVEYVQVRRLALPANPED